MCLKRLSRSKEQNRNLERDSEESINEEIEKAKQGEQKRSKNVIPPASLNRDLSAYNMLFEAKVYYLREIINKKFKKHTISWNKYTEIIEKAEESFYIQIEAANRIWDLNILVNEEEINEIYQEKLDNINKILTEIEGLMIEFIKNEEKPDETSLECLLEEIRLSKIGVDKYVKE